VIELAAHRLQTSLDIAAEQIDGFESKLGMELLSTVDWLTEGEDCEATMERSAKD
jgi:hypothetical protein